MADCAAVACAAGVVVWAARGAAAAAVCKIVVRLLVFVGVICGVSVVVEKSDKHEIRFGIVFVDCAACACIVGAVVLAAWCAAAAACGVATVVHSADCVAVDVRIVHLKFVV